jgi:hypothetical protein
MFKCSKFNKDISGWNVNNVEYIDKMFYGSEFGKDISIWKLNNIKEDIT